ncbi:MFS transporter [Mycolicibacterium sp. P9-64]|uniref:MFS transporter n=1 Tax=Mycolicibacterium sp. P9-64 TaxID=2024612 RepID=UPI0011F07E2B|nr:MFS transporter [Mycolicibacterium sp. P9-64]KAA0084585.1 MFS transporter [Mycolicibacterium sp. P9-64]
MSIAVKNPLFNAEGRKWASLGVLTLAVVLVTIDGTVLALAVPALVADLGPTATQLLWIGDIYSFAVAGFLLTMGNVADRIGRKRLLILGCVGFGFASVLAAFATAPELLIAARALLGLSAATLMPCTLAIIRDIFERPAHRTRAIAVWSAGAMAGAAAGPLLGGVLLEHFWWGSVFLINVPVIIVLLPLAAVLLPESRNPVPATVDILSAALSLAATLSFVYGLKHSFAFGVDWTSTLALVIAVVVGGSFVRRQWRLAQPLFDISLFRVRAFSGGMAVNTIAIFAFSGTIFFFSQYLQLVRGLSPLEAGLVQLPATLTTVVVTVFAGRLVARLGNGLTVGWGMVIGGTGLVLLALAEGLPDILWTGLALAILVLGATVAMTVAIDVVVGAVPRERAGAASAISETGYELGIAFGIGILGSLTTAFYRNGLSLPDGMDNATRTAVTESLADAHQVLAVGGPHASAPLSQAQHSFASAMQLSSGISAVLMIVAGIVAWKVIPAVGTDRH